MQSQWTVRMAAGGILAILAIGCAGGGTTGENDPFDRAEPPEVMVENRNWMDMTIYAIRGDTRLRLGMVPSQTTRTFELPRASYQASPEIRLLADPIGTNSAHRSPAVAVEGGERIEWTLQANLATSSLRVRPDNVR